MPGITGIISNKSFEQNRSDLLRMVSCMNHGPFYNSGHYVISELGLYVGWTVHKESFSDCMPVKNEKGDLVLIYSGDNLVDPEDVKALKTKHGRDKNKKNAEYLIDLYEEKNEQFFGMLNGFFQGIIADTTNSEIIIFNDRYGMSRLYYYSGNDEFIFSSEAKAILEIRPFLKRLDMQSLGEYFSCNCVLENRSLFKDINILPGGAKWAFNREKSIKKSFYFLPKEWEDQDKLDDENFSIAIIEKLNNIMPKYLESGQRLGLSLTGGLDTRMILSVADINSGSLPCFTYGGMYRDSYDVIVSKKVAERCSQPYHILRLDRNFLEKFNEYAEKTLFITDGCLDVTGAPNLYMAMLARNIADIRLTGNYGQEVLRRYLAFKPNPPSMEMFNPDFHNMIKLAKETYQKTLNEVNRQTFALFRQAPWFQHSRYSLENAIMGQRSPFIDNEIVKLAYQAPITSLNNENLSKKIINASHRNLGRIITDLGKLGVLPSPLATLLKAWRYFLFKMEWYYNHHLPRPVEKIDNIIGKRKIERRFIGRHKYYHMRIWFRDELSNYIQQILLDKKCLNREFNNGAYLSDIVDGHLKKGIYHTDDICKALSVELMCRQFID